MTDAEAEARLMADSAATEQRIAAMTADLAALAAAADGSNSDDEHDPEGATLAFEREQLAELRSRAHAHLAEIGAALGRLRDHLYGQCELCSRPIAQARLAVLPAARLCVTCAGRREH